MATLDRLLDSLFESNQNLLYQDLRDWLQTSRRFRAFTQTYHTKIRAKIKNVRDESGMQDLRAELQAAALLLREERFALEYEKYAALKQRGPDFTVTFKTHTPFNVEVRRVRHRELDATAFDAHIGKLMAVLCEKLGQMPPGIVNLLWLTGEREILPEDVARAVGTLRQLAEHKENDFFARRGLENAANFNKHVQRLSGTVLYHADTNAVWLNSIARHPTPPEIVNALRRLTNA